MPATISILGLYEYDASVLDPIKAAMPTATIAGAVANGILSECAELEILYPNPSTFKTILQSWVTYRTVVWDKLYSTTQYVYNPIYNYDRHETETLTREKDVGRSGSYNQTSSGSNSETEHPAGTTNLEYRYGFNETDKPTPAGIVMNANWYSSNPADPLNQLYRFRAERTDNTTNSSSTDSSNSSTEDESETVTRTLTNQGNIGVVSTQQMISMERDIDRYDFVEDVINDFKSKFCLLVY